MTGHWADDPTNDIDWTNYTRGWDAGRATIKVDLTGHGQPFCDGYADGYAERNNH